MVPPENGGPFYLAVTKLKCNYTFKCGNQYMEGECKARLYLAINLFSLSRAWLDKENVPEGI